VRCLGNILQSTLQGRGILQGQEDKGCTNNNDVGQLISIMQNKNEMGCQGMVLTWDNSASCNDQTRRQGIKQQST
jgi:hypothetical protein